MIISYSLSDLPQTEKVKVNRALYGSISKSNFRGKEYKTETKGLINEPGIQRINKAVIIAERRLSAKITNMLRRFKVQFREIPVWTY